MKKKIILVVAVLAILITLICIPKTTYQKWFGKTPNDNPVDTNKEYQTIFVVDEKNKLVGLKVPVEEIEEDQIAQKWNLLTSQMNKIPQGYSSPITPSTVLNDYKIEDNKLILNVSEDILRSSGRLAIESLAWTFCNDEIKEVVLRVDENVVNLISDYQFNKISKEIGTNFTYETSYLFEADYTTVVFYENDFILPVTYFYKDINEYDFMISKIFSENNIELTDYTYTIDNENLVIQINDNITMSDSLKQTLEETVKLNFSVDAMTVNGVDTVLYEKTFVEVN
ncbi:MAG TPA: hypothetical protein DCR62_03570 [Acholeplasmatales bacterium]|jgi:hypothetical protein|nr:GerMN domain-containing protein [Bacilli bacterium]MBS6561793.1 GerMN domain-containing protein [Staphylococcus sp.]CDC69697.1 putative uncharacterized protein [Staphylococcus sp. CAG:324]HAR57802.1 hypothetical protein [Acholeplasmatales bacterium]